MIIENTNTHVTLCPKYTHGTHRRQHIISLSAALKEFGVTTREPNQEKTGDITECVDTWDRKSCFQL